MSPGILPERLLPSLAFGRKVKATSELICPLCQLTLRHGDVEPHFTYEIEKLAKSHLSKPSTHLAPQQLRQNSSIPHSSYFDPYQGTSSVTVQASSSFTGEPSTASCVNVDIDSLPSNPATSSVFLKDNPLKKLGHDFQSYKRVKINRLLRLQKKRWEVTDMGEEAICPVCEENVQARTAADLQLHVDRCLRKREEGEGSSDEEVEVEGDEYEWCGMRKVRLTSLLKSQGQLDALGTLVKKGDEDTNVEVCLLQEEEDRFGPSQYSQEDMDLHLIRSSDEEEEPENHSQELLLSPNSSHTSDIEDSIVEAPKERCAAEKSPRLSTTPVVEALQFKIRELEERGNFICHICHGPYAVPLTSIVCWHVHCEKCWLQTLSSQKLCPQCKMIVVPTDLRKIYL